VCLEFSFPFQSLEDAVQVQEQRFGWLQVAAGVQVEGEQMLKVQHAACSMQHAALPLP